MKLTKEEKIEKLFERGVLVNESLLGEELKEDLLEKIENEEDLIIINEDYANIIKQSGSLVDWYDLDKYRVDSEKDRDDELYQIQLQSFKKSNLILQEKNKETKQELSSLETELILVNKKKEMSANFTTEIETKEELDLNTQKEIQKNELNSSSGYPNFFSNISSTVTVILSYKNEPRKYEVKDFTNFFLSRYRYLESLLRHRQELNNTLTISRVLDKKDKENVSIIGLVEDIGETKNGNLMLTIEDITGKIKVFVGKNKDLYNEAKDLVLDEVVGISGVSGDKIIFADNIVWPDIPSNNELKKGPEEEYVIFLSDIHVGSNLFLEEEFNKFLEWINGRVGNDKQRAIARKVKYIVIAGDLVDGVGIYPSQQEELAIEDITEQYVEFSRLIKKIPKDKEIIICPGNHDAVHLAEPQPAFNREFCGSLFEIPNVTLVTNPSIVNIGKKENFSGFNVLLYHGYSFDYYVANVESIRNGGGYHRSDLIMKFLLKRRHLAPSFKSTPYYPSHKEDPLLIKNIPDFFITGHIHYSSVANYKGITMISGSCWQGKTTFQEKLGHEPEPARVPLVNLKTREVKVLRF